LISLVKEKNVFISVFKACGRTYLNLID
jgi:hypothetical protein